MLGRRFSALVVFVAAALACAPRTKLPKAATAASSSHITRLMHGVWVGKASPSPLGIQPYALMFSQEDNAIVAETPQTLGEEVLAPGASQRFVFTSGSAGGKLKFHTSMGGKAALDGELDLVADRSDDANLVFCEPSDCDKMEIRWRSVDDRSLSLQVYMKGHLHVDIAMQLEGER